MAALTIRLPEARRERLRQMAKHRGVSVNKLVEELSTAALAQFDAELRFRALARRGNPAAGLRILAKLDRAFAGQR